MGRFEDALKFTLSFEGGFSNHPADRGGPTMKGITQSEYDRYRRREGFATQSVQHIAQNELHDIYQEYWNATHAGAFVFPLAVTMFDIGVNHGNGRAIRFFQALRGLKVDGQVGPKTLAEFREVGALPFESQQRLASSMCDLREDFYHSIVRNNASQSVFLHGWLRRVNELRELVKESGAS